MRISDPLWSTCPHGEVLNLTQEYARLSAELEKLPAHREAKQAEQVLGSEVAGLEREIQFKTAELQGKGPERMALCNYS